jgi:hypothetical protein
MQTTVRDAPEMTVAVDTALPARGSVIVALGGIALLATVLGGPVLAATLAGAVPAIVVATALLVALAGIVWRFGIEFERAWLRSYSGPLLGDECPSRQPIVLLQPCPGDPRAGRRSEYVGLGGARTPARKLS